MTKFIEGLFDNAFRGVEKQLDLTWKRNQAISSNIANAETPQYRAVDVNFATELERAFGTQGSELSPIAKTDSQHLYTLKNSGAHTIPDLSGQTRGDGNNVDLDIQMGKLAYNSGSFSMANNLIKKKFYFIPNKAWVFA